MNIRHWWIEKSQSSNMAYGVEFCEFQPTIHRQKMEWIKVISLDDFHREAGINITKYISMTEELATLRAENEKLLSLYHDHLSIHDKRFIENEKLRELVNGAVALFLDEDDSHAHFCGWYDSKEAEECDCGLEKWHRKKKEVMNG